MLKYDICPFSENSGFAVIGPDVCENIKLHYIKKSLS